MQPLSLACVAVALIAATGAAPGTAAEELAVEAQRRGDRIEVRASALVAAPPQLVWSVLTDYESLPRFIPGIAKSSVRQRDGNRLLVDQSGEARFLLFSFPIEVTLEITESPANWISSRAVGGNVRMMIGRYDLHAEPARAAVLLRYYGLIEPDFELPPLVGTAALRGTVEEQFTAMVAEIERRAAAGRK